MTKEHFQALSKKYYPNFSPKRLEFLNKLVNLFDEYETESGEILGGSIIFPPHDHPLKSKEYGWNGQFFI